MLRFITPRVLMDLLGGREPLRFSVTRLRCVTFLNGGGSTVPDYEQLYHLMVNASECALAALEAGDAERARALLIEAERSAEEQYIESE